MNVNSKRVGQELVAGFRSFNISVYKKVLNMLEVGYLRLFEVVIKRTT